VQLFFRQSGWF